jgi:hypothetical protein
LPQPAISRRHDRSLLGGWSLDRGKLVFQQTYRREMSASPGDPAPDQRARALEAHTPIKAAQPALRKVDDRYFGADGTLAGCNVQVRSSCRFIDRYATETLYF